MYHLLFTGMVLVQYTLYTLLSFTCACYRTCCNVVSICLHVLLEFQNFTRQFGRFFFTKLIQTHTALTYTRYIQKKHVIQKKKNILTFKIDDMYMLLQTIHLLHGKGRTSVVGWSLLLHCVWHFLQCSYKYLTVTNLKLMLLCIWMNICMVCSGVFFYFSFIIVCFYGYR